MTEFLGNTRPLTANDFSVPITERYFEDYTAGAIYEYGYLDVTAQDIHSFAIQFDPQPIHIDEEFAAHGPFSGIIGSGWHSGSLAMRMIADHYLSKVASLASPGIDELRWAAPLRAGDRLRLRTETLETRLSRSKPDRGLVQTKVELLNQDDRCPVSFRAMNFIGCRPS